MSDHLDHSDTFEQDDADVIDNYDRSLTTLAESANGLIPRGWQATFDEMLAQLRAVSHPGRAKTVFDGFTINDGVLSLMPQFPDSVVLGIARRYSRKLSCTCWRCGRPGHGRRLGLSTVPLCSGCYGLRALRTDIKQLLKTLETDEPRQKDVLLETDLPPRIRPVLADVWRVVEPAGSPEPVRCLSAAALQQEAPRLRSLLNELDRMLAGIKGIPASGEGDSDAR